MQIRCYIWLQLNPVKQPAMKKPIAMIAAAAVLLASTGCAHRGANYVPLVDTKYKDQAVLAQDVTECQVFAKTRMDAAEGAVAGALIGALLGAAIAPRGYRNSTAAYGAGVGAISGGAAAHETQETITKRCLMGRGYNVLN